MVTGIVGKGLNSTVKAKRQAPLIFPREIRKKSHGEGDNLSRDSKDRSTSTEGLSVKVSIIKKK